MEFKLDWPCDKTSAHQVFIPVHKNNYLKVMKNHSLLGKQMEPHGSEQFERKLQAWGADSKCMSKRISTESLRNSLQMRPETPETQHACHMPSIIKHTGCSASVGSGKASHFPSTQCLSMHLHLSFRLDALVLHSTGLPHPVLSSFLHYA